MFKKDVFLFFFKDVYYLQFIFYVNVFNNTENILFSKINVTYSMLLFYSMYRERVCLC